MKTGIELISEERQKQIDKHGFTAEHHANNNQYYDRDQLISASITLLNYENWNDIGEFMQKTYSGLVPTNWDSKWWLNLLKRSKKERVIIAGALLASELDRLEYLESIK